MRNPVKGKVKTRIAQSLGDDKALLIYRILLEHTQYITQHIECAKYVFYADNINEYDGWLSDIYHRAIQSNGDLGNKMSKAFEQIFNTGATQAIIIGSDCYDLRAVDIEKAFDLLAEADIVIGPASDGGYYLLGMKIHQPALFENISWSTALVLQETLGICTQQGLKYILLPVLNDVDEEKDINFEY